MPSTRFAPFVWLVVLPVCTLLFGWQWGQRSAQTQLQDAQNRLNVLYGLQGQSGAVIGDPEKQVDISILWGVWRLLNDRYIDPSKLQVNTMVNGAVTGMVASIGDPYTVFMTPKETQDFSDSLEGHLEGIGAELTIKDSNVVVVSPIKGSPADRAGVRPQDIITEVDGKSIEGLSLNDVVAKIRGKKGTSVTLTIMRSPQIVKLTIVRDDIHVPSVEYEVKTTTKGKIGLLTINQFGGETVQEAKAFLTQQDVASLKGLIIDLRNNGGGYLDGAVELSSLFLREGTVVSIAGRDGPIDSKSVDGKPLLPDLPLVILINQGTASASEITAGAMQDHKRATIVGMKSFGKGTVQEIDDLPGGASLKMTIARWLTPNGKDLGKEGVFPDIAVDRTEADYKANKDPQLDAALTWMVTGKRTGSGGVVH